MKKAIVAYVPVLHEGYRRFFDKHKDAKVLFLLGKNVTNEFKQLTKDIRAIDPELVKAAIEAWGIFEEVTVLDEPGLLDFDSLIMPAEDVMKEIKEKIFPKAKVEWDSIFLRWDKHKSTEGKPVEADQKVSKDAKDVEIIQALNKEAEKSADWWRHVAAAIVKDGKIVSITHNKHVPHEQMPYVNGDPRADFSKGINLDLATSFHCESRLISEAARDGVSLRGASMYVNTFPCPPCAKSIAYSGINKLYYSGGYGVLDGESILKSQGIEIIFVDTGKAGE